MGHPSPNLFQFATSELSQDAFIAWLISWAHPDFASLNGPLHQTGVELLNTLFDKIGHSKPERYDSIKAELQVKHIDVLVTINGSIPLIIEDKTFTEDHSTQLSDYVKTVSGDFKINSEKVPAIYFKTGDQSNFERVDKAGYKVFNRSDFLKILQSGIERGITSDIFINYRDHLQQLDDEIESFSSTLVNQWKPHWNGWVGFFKLLQEKLGGGEWGYVSNTRGGFMCFHWNHTSPTSEMSDFEVYPQLEESRLCFKIQVLDVKQQAIQWENWHQKLMSASKTLSFPLERPSRRKNGRWMTVALNDDYLQKNSGGYLDIDATVAVLKKAEDVLKTAAGS